MDLDRYTCEQAFRRLDDYIDRELNSDEMQRVREHLDICALCAAEFQFEAETMRAMRERIQCIVMPTNLMNQVTAALVAARRSPELSAGEQQRKSRR